MKELMLNTAKALSDEQAGGHGDRWDVFDGGTETILNSLGTIIEKAELLDTGMANEADAKAVITAGAPQGILLLYTGKENGTSMTGVMSVIHVDPGGPDREPSNQFLSSYPFFGDGAEVEGVVDDLSLFPNRLEARLTIEVVPLGCLIFAFDPLFCLHRTLYREGETYQFSVSALAYSMESAQNQEYVIDDPEEIRSFRARRAWAEKHGQWVPKDKAASLASWQPETPEDMEPIRFDMSKLTMLMPATENNPADDASYMGEVVRVTPDAVNMLDTRFWRVDVTLLRTEEDATITVPIYVSEKLFKGDWRPSVGEYVTGSLWLQAYVRPDPKVMAEKNHRKKFELSTDGPDELYPSWDFVEEALRKTHGYFLSKKDKKDYGKYCVLSFVAGPKNFIQTAYQRVDAEDTWRLERRDWHPDGSWTHYYARLITDNEDDDMIKNFDCVINAFKAFYYEKPLPENLVWIEWNPPLSSGG